MEKNGLNPNGRRHVKWRGSRLWIGLALWIAGGCGIGFANDVFAPWVNAGAPTVLREIADPDRDLEAGDRVRVRRVVFASRVVSGVTNEVYAVIARPAAAGRYPGLLLLHGGLGVANEGEAVNWARRGYVAVAPDLPGIANPVGAVRSAGLWRHRPYGSGVWLTSPSAEASAIHQAVVAALQGFHLMQAQPDVDTGRVGVSGWSWGGYMSTMVCGLLGERIQAGFSYFGTGFYEHTWFKFHLDLMSPTDRAEWLEQLDAGRRAPGIAAPFFIAAPANDTFFHPTAVERTLAVIPGEVGRVYSPNAHHQLWIPGGSWMGAGDHLAEMWFAGHLKSEAEPFPTVEWETSGDPDTVAFRVRGSRPFIVVSLWHSLPRHPESWPERVWVQVPVRLRAGGRYEATLKPEARALGAAWFAMVSDDRSISVSTPMQVAGEGVVAAYYYHADFEGLQEGSVVPGWTGDPMVAVDPLEPMGGRVFGRNPTNGIEEVRMALASTQEPEIGLRLAFRIHAGNPETGWESRWMLSGGQGDGEYGYGFELSEAGVQFLRRDPVAGGNGVVRLGERVGFPGGIGLKPGQWNRVRFEWESGGRLKLFLEDERVATHPGDGVADGKTMPVRFQVLAIRTREAEGAVELYYDDVGVGPLLPPPLPPLELRLMEVGEPGAAEPWVGRVAEYVFEGVPGQTYVMEVATELLAGEWVGLGEFDTGSSGRFRVRVDRPGNEQWPGELFFRATMREPARPGR